MMSPGEFIPIVLGIGAGTTIMLSPVFIVRMILKHREKLEAMKYRQDGAPGLIEEMSALRREMQALRDTTTKFDMSFDAALSRIEDRVQTLEGGRHGTHGERTGAAPTEPDTQLQWTGRPGV